MSLNNKAISLKDAMKAYREKNVNNKDISSISISSKPKNNNVSTMYYDPKFSLGEDLHSNKVQEEQWKEAVQDGRVHISHREQTKLRSSEFEEAINQYDIIQFFIKELTYKINDDKSTLFTRLNIETTRIIIDYAYPGQGVLLTSDLMMYEQIHDKENIHTYGNDNFPFRLCARKRPLQEFELKENAYDCIDTKTNSTTIHEGRLARNGRQLSMRHIKYTIDRVWDETVDNQKLCIEEIDPLINYVFDGNNATVICFGQTGTGKTYTLMGALEHVSSRFVGSSIAVSFFEIHGKKCFDLMNARKTLQVMSDDKEEIHVKGITTAKIIAQNNTEIMTLLQEALNLRSSECTERNSLSSRSHAVCNIKLLDGDDNVVGKLMLVDLAGSERNYETQKMTAQMHRESADINFSLMALKDCFRAYHSNLTGNKYMQRTESRCNNPINDKVIARAPYRSSLLTRILRECFILDATINLHRTLLIATLSPSPSDVTHSINTLDHVSLMSPVFQSLTTSVIVEVPLLGAPLSSASIDTWTHENLNVWLATADGGRFSSLALPPNIDGAKLLELDSEDLSTLFTGQLREARQEVEGMAWVEGIEENEKHHYLAKALWSSLRRTNLHAQIAREKQANLSQKEKYYYDM